jgi:hypothetical protein
VTRDDVEDVIARWTGIPVNSLKEEETQKLLRNRSPSFTSASFLSGPRFPRSLVRSGARVPD